MTKFRVYDAKQCRSTDFMSGCRCQGVEGHKKPHWCYREDGFLEQWKSKKDIKGPGDWAASSTPPDHKSYIHPKDKIKEHHRSHCKIVNMGIDDRD